MQLLNSLFVAGHGYRHHPASKMWRGYEAALIAYAAVMCEEWTALGFGDTCLPQIAARGQVRTQAELAELRELPPWLGDPDFHRAHQSNLIRKDPDRYGRLFPGVPPDLPYIWPPGRGAAT